MKKKKTVQFFSCLFRRNMQIHQRLFKSIWIFSRFFLPFAFVRRWTIYFIKTIPSAESVVWIDWNWYSNYCCFSCCLISLTRHLTYSYIAKSAFSDFCFNIRNSMAYDMVTNVLTFFALYSIKKLQISHIQIIENNIFIYKKHCN